MRRGLERAAGVALGLLFLWSGAWKLAHSAEFLATVARFGLVPDALVPASAWLVLALELATGLGLACAWRAALGAALALVLLFLAVLAYGLHLGLDLDCGCFGPLGQADLGQAFRRDLVLLALVGYLYARRRTEDRRT